MPKPAARPAQTRGSALAQIHIAKKEMGWSDEEYRDLLFTVCRVRSAKDLDHAGREKFLSHAKRCGWKPKPATGKPAQGSPNEGAPHNLHSEQRGPQLQKVGALLASAQRPWAYADGMAYRMFGKARLALCDQDELQRLIAALNYDANRRAKRAATAPQEPHQ